MTDKFTKYTNLPLALVMALFFSMPAAAQTVSLTPSSGFTNGTACTTNGSLSNNGNSFVGCTSGAWAVNPVQVGTASSAPYTCSGTYEGMLYYDTGSSAIKVCGSSGSWAAVGSGGGGTPGGSNTQVQYNGSGSFVGDSSFTYVTPGALSLGVAASHTGTLALSGGTSGTVTITPQATAGTPTLTLPNTTGTFAVSASTPLSLSATTGALTLGTVGVGNGGTGTATTFTQGSVVFIGTSGVYTQDNSQFFWDNTNYRLGIGSATPTSAIEVHNGSIVTDSITNTANYINFGTSNAQITSNTSTSVYVCGMKDGGSYTLLMNAIPNASNVTINAYPTYVSTSSCSGTAITVDLGAGSSSFVSVGTSNIVSFIFFANEGAHGTLYGSIATNYAE